MQTITPTPQYTQYNTPYFHIDIQCYSIDNLKHWRAGYSNTNDFTWEDRPGETMNALKRRIMEELNSGAVFHHLEDWKLL